MDATPGPADSAARLERLVLASAEAASQIRTMVVVGRVRVRGIRETLGQTEGEIIRTVVVSHPNRVEELHVAIQSNTPVHRRAEDQLTDVSRIIAADVEGDLVTLYTWLLRGRLREPEG